MSSPAPNLRLWVKEGDQVRAFPLPAAGGVLRLGSSADNDLVLPITGVSREHARLIRDGDVWLLLDSGSKNGLFVDGARREALVLTEGRTVQMGNALVRLEAISTADAEAALTVDSQPSSTHLPLRTADTEDAAGGPAAALRFLHRHGEFDLAQERGRSEVMGAARKVIGATALLLLHRGAGELALMECSGEAPADDLWQALDDRIGKWPADGIASWPVRGNRALVAGTAEGPILLAYFARRIEDPPAWSRDFLRFLCARIEGSEVLAAAAEQDSREPLPLSPPEGMVLGEAPRIRPVLERVRLAAATSCDVLLLGETGTGKELFARLIHRSSPRAAAPFVAVNCAALPAELLEAELFGVGRRVATAVDPRPGLFRAAEGGTLLLDEIGEMPLPLQAKLLRVLQEREVLGVGERRPRRIDLRVIAASNRDLAARASDGSFRGDLYYRLQELEISLPPLRDRPEDLPQLALTFARRAARTHGKKVRALSRGALERLSSHGWPGNIRELRNVIGRAVLNCPHRGMIEASHLELGQVAATTEPHRSREPSAEAIAPREQQPNNLAERIAALEQEEILRALEANQGNKTRAAKELGITRQGLLLKMKRLGLA